MIRYFRRPDRSHTIPPIPPAKPRNAIRTLSRFGTIPGQLLNAGPVEPLGSARYYFFRIKWSTAATPSRWFRKPPTRRWPPTPTWKREQRSARIEGNPRSFRLQRRTCI